MVNPRKMIIFSICLIALGVIFAAATGIYNLYNYLETNKAFEDAKTDRSALKTKLDVEFEKASEELHEHKNELNEKVENEANKIIEELRLKASEVGKSMVKLKEEVNDANKEINSLKLLSEQKFLELSYPLPTSFTATSIITNFETDIVSDQLNAIREKFKTVNPDEVNYDRVHGDIDRENLDETLIESIRQSSLSMNLQLGDENGPFYKNSKNIIWLFETKLDLDNNNTLFQYDFNKIPNPNEEIKLIINDNDGVIANSRLRTISGISSAKEICGKKVFISLSITGALKLGIPKVIISQLLFRDEYNREYMVEFEGVQFVKFNDSATINKASNKSMDVGQYFLVGKLKCLSI